MNPSTSPDKVAQACRIAIDALLVGGFQADCPTIVSLQSVLAGLASATSPTLGVFSLKYFSRLDWAWTEVKVLASSTDEVLAYVDAECAAQYRDRPYRREKAREAKPFEDSLEIRRERDAVLPFFLRE